jgi:uncharacterized protein YndB with AHSA1/START domain
MQGSIERREEILMSTQAQDTSVRAHIVVEVPIEHAFAVFTESASWKPPEHNLLEVEIAESVFEAHEGGYIYDRGADGSECRWARVLAYEPPHRVVFGWLITPQWRLESDISRASEVEVRFITEAPERTRVEIEHRHLERHGEGWEATRDAVGSPDGWQLYLQRFAEQIAA